jgi:hypothetical protein
MFGFGKENKKIVPATPDEKVKFEIPIVAIPKYLKKDDLHMLAAIIHDYPKEFHDPAIAEQVREDVETYLKERLDDIAVEDETAVHKIYELEQLHIIPLERFKESPIVKEAVIHAMKICQENSNLNLISRINNLPFYEAA